MTTTMARGVFKGALVLIFAFVQVPFLAAQGGLGRGRLTGVVLDDNDNPIPSAKITLRFLGKVQARLIPAEARRTDSATFETAAGKDGKWSRNSIAGGWWNITASAEGFHAANRDCFVRELSPNPNVGLTLTKLESPFIKSTVSALERANDLFYLKKYDEAMAAYREYLKTEPGDIMVALNIAYCLQDKGDLEAAIAEFEAIARRTATDPRDAFLTGRAYAGAAECYHQRKDETKAKAFFIKALDAFPENELWAYNVGEIAASRREMDEAIRYYDKARTISPGWPDPLYKLGLCWLNKGDNARALDAFEKFLKLELGTKRAEDAAKILPDLKKRIASRS